MWVLAYITVPDEDQARGLARQLVENRFAAGANVAGPVFSVYRWQGHICEAREWQIFAQVRREDFDDLARFVRDRHVHHVPCVLALDIGNGYEPFLQWIENKGDFPCEPPSSPCRL